MIRVKGTIEGVAPILFSRFYQDPNGPGGKPKAEEIEKEPFLKCHRDENGIYIPGGMFKQSVLGGAKAGNVKDGKRSYATTLEAIMFPEGRLYLNKQEHDDVFEHWGRRPPKTGGAMIIRYPLFRIGWTADFSVVLTMGDKNTVDALRRSVDSAGFLVGLGSWRPEYGRFVVTTWEVEKIN